MLLYIKILKSYEQWVKVFQSSGRILVVDLMILRAFSNDFERSLM